MSKSQIKRPDRLVKDLGADTQCTVLHVDMDAFYVAVELLDRPELRGTPVIVGGQANRGVVLSASYEARAQGVYSGMPMSRARRQCPQATIIRPDHHRYSVVSQSVLEIFRSITDRVEPLAADEAFLDVAAAVRRLGTPREIGEEIRARIYDEQGITASVGVAESKFIAKLATTRAKPDGLLVVPSEAVVSFLHPMPVSSLWGVGEKTEEKLHRLGLRTIGDIARTPVTTLQRMFGAALGRTLSELSWGHDEREVQREQRERSIGAEETFATDVIESDIILTELRRLSEKVASSVRQQHLVGRTVVLKVRFADFTTITRSKTVADPLDVAFEIYHLARQLYEAMALQRARIRLVGIRLEKLRSASGQARQLQLGEPEVGWRELEQTVDEVAAKFGRSSVKPARLVVESETHGG